MARRLARWGDEPWSSAFAVLGEHLRGQDIGAALLSHRLALLVEELGELGAAETLHRHASVLLTRHPTEPGIDRHRVEWACSLAVNLVAQERLAEAEAVLLAAWALAEALLGPDDFRTREIRHRLREL